jgi:hypothetical protein
MLPPGAGTRSLAAADISSADHGGMLESRPSTTSVSVQPDLLQSERAVGPGLLSALGQWLTPDLEDALPFDPVGALGLERSLSLGQRNHLTNDRTQLPCIDPAGELS